METLPSVTARPIELSISWAAIFAGSVVSIAIGGVLTLLGTAFGMTFASGYAPASTGHSFAPEIGAWMLAAQVVSLGLGGYLSGRLRHQWVGVHGDESHFRDTAHGLIVWAVCTIAGGILAATALAPINETVGAAAVPAPTPAEVERGAHIVAQSALFMAIGLLLSAFSAAIAARIGGIQSEGWHSRRVS